MDELTPLLEKLAAKLGTTTEYLWEVLLKQAHLDAIYYIFQSFLIIIASYVWYKVSKKVSININEGDWEEENYIWVGIGWIVIAIFWGAMFFSITELNGIFHPEYWALSEIKGLIK